MDTEEYIDRNAHQINYLILVSNKNVWFDATDND